VTGRLLLDSIEPPVAAEILRRSDGGRCEVGATGCEDRFSAGMYLVDDVLPVEAGTVLHACRPCRARCDADPALARRLSGVPA